MSLLSTDRVFLGLSPDHVSALVVRGLMWRRLVAERTLPAINKGHQASLPWEEEVAAIDTLLQEDGWRDQDISVVLSSHYVRHIVVPAESGLSEAALLKLAGVLFQDIFGDMAREWELRVSPTRHGKTTVACGVPRSRLEALSAVCQAHGRLRSIQPVLMAVFNHIRRGIGNGPVSLAVVENGRVTVGTLENGQWQYIDSRAGNGNLLNAVLEESAILHQHPGGGTLWLCNLSTASISLPLEDGWRVRPVLPPHLAGIEVAQAGETGLALWGAA